MPLTSDKFIEPDGVPSGGTQKTKSATVGVTDFANVAFTGLAADVGLGNVDNTSDLESNPNFIWTFDAGLSGDPGVGKWGANNADLTLATEIRINDISVQGNNGSAIFVLLNDFAGVTFAQVSQVVNSVAYSINGAPVDNTTYFSFPVLFVDLDGVINAGSDFGLTLGTDYPSIEAIKADKDGDSLTNTTVNSVVLSTSGIATEYLDETGVYSPAVPIPMGFGFGSQQNNVANTIIVTIDTDTLINVSLVASGFENNFTVNPTNLTYTGLSDPRQHKVFATITAEKVGGGPGEVISFRVFKNGSPVTISAAVSVDANLPQSLTLVAPLQLVASDIFEVFCQNNSGTDDILVSDIAFFVE